MEKKSFNITSKKNIKINFEREKKKNEKENLIK